MTGSIALQALHCFDPNSIILGFSVIFVSTDESAASGTAIFAGSGVLVVSLSCPEQQGPAPKPAVIREIKNMAHITVLLNFTTVLNFSEVLISAISSTFATRSSFEMFLDFFDARHFTDEFYIAIDCQGRSHHYAEAHDFVDIGDLYQLIAQAEFFCGSFGFFSQFVTFGAAGAENLNFHDEKTSINRR